ncbi:MAG: hypothetical protein D3908_12195, partial [Candidatus Electrothrix sp. AUS4]|nr:hypothetical protein [Candidatus Electrothrix sp. AUS4]
MGSYDERIIIELECALGIKLFRDEDIDSAPCYVTDTQDQVIALNLSNAALGKVTEAFAFLKDLWLLRDLYLSNCQISDISFLKNLRWLQFINLSQNKIKHIDVFKGFNSIFHLDLRNNNITKLPFWITKLSPEIVFSDNYEPGTINIGGNPLTNPPPEIIKQGREAILAYFKSLEKEESVSLNECKVILVGEGMSGKTSLLKRLQGLDFDNKESQTHGINVLSLSSNQLPGFNNDDECRLHFWDFGG